MTNKITFIAPKVKDRTWYKHHPTLSPYTLAVLASLVPKNWEPKIMDENVSPLNMNEDTDLAAISVTTASAPRAYEIADKFKEREIPSLLGNIHPTVLPKEAMEHGTVVAREAENTLPKVLRDYENDVLKEYYDGGHCSLDTPKLPRFDLFTKKYVINLIQYSRGCPNDCEFCSVSTTNGHKHRHKKQQRFIDEINSCGEKIIFIADDNFLGSTREDKEDVKSLLKKMKDETNIKWATQVTVNFAKDEELLRSAVESGCTNVVIGFETIDPYCLKEAKKFVNYRKNYRKIISKIHDYGISIVGTFIFGFDNDTKNVFGNTVDFVKDTEIDINKFEVLTPFPGTKLEERLRREGRIFRDNYPEDWSFYNCNNVVFHPKNMTAKELDTGTLEAMREMSNPLPVFYRSLKTVINTKSIYGAGSSGWVNFSVGLHVRNKLRKNNYLLPNPTIKE